MLPADDGLVAQQLSMRAVPRDRHRVCGRLEISAAEDSCREREDSCRRRYDSAHLHRSLGIATHRSLDSDSFFANEMESDAEQAVASVSRRGTEARYDQRDDVRMNRHRALDHRLSVIFSEIRVTFFCRSCSGAAIGAASAAAEIRRARLSRRQAHLRANELLRAAPPRFLRFRFVPRERKAGEAGTKAVGGGCRGPAEVLTKVCADTDNPIRLG